MNKSLTFVTALAVTALAAPATTAAGQVVRGDVALGGGMATDQRGVRSNAVTFAPSVLLAPDPQFSAVLSLSATQFGNNANALGGTATLGASIPLGSVFALAASASGSVTHTSFNSTFTSTDVTPTLEATLADVTLFAGARVASGRSSIAQATTPGGIFGAPVAGAQDLSRSSTGAVFGGVLNVADDRPDERGTLGYREEHAKVGQVAVTDRVATAAYSSGEFSVAASGGVRDAVDESTGFGSVNATLALSPSVALQAAAGTYPSNRLTGIPGGQFVSLGLSLHGWRRIDDPLGAATHVNGAPPVVRGMTRLAITAPAATRVELAGDWNQWTPMLATKGPDGQWYADVRLPHGDYRYSFRIDGQRWRVPEGVPSVDDGFGGRSAVVSVR